ncbi:MAG: hypothetical protein K2G41_01765 [Duncaniella sp.]|uniref:hypothetical protein n=1 Tax=Duncaniella sp. TaxID=2518496 RepID=UPI0023C18053|nr:hypothetical protein [Duncaniella sp.]MDE6089405.1 hypothetical protein [Duncaniella sp.]
MLQTHKRLPFLSACLSVMAGLLLGACVNEDTPCPPDRDPNAEKGVTLEFSMVTRNASGRGSRALIEPTAGTREVGTEAENYLDLDNLIFLLVDDQQTVIRVFSPNVTPEENSRYAKYSVRAFINDKYFLDAEPGGNLTFSIVVIGNYSTLDPQSFAYHAGQKLSEVFASATVGTFAMPVSNNWMNKWIPSMFGTAYTDAAGELIEGMTPAHIPMSGMHTYTVSTDDLLASTVNRPFNLSADANGSGDINMLRALAKIEIVDRIGIGTGTTTTQPDRTERSWVEKAELIGYTTRGSILPTFTQWNRGSLETQYVTSTSVPASATYFGAEPANAQLTINGRAINFFDDAEATEAREDGCRVFSCYLTEYNPADRGTAYPMWIRVTASSPAPEGVTPTSALYRLDVSSYTNGVPGTPLSILRNNIYRYEINGIATVLQPELIVNDWESEETVWDYNDNPGIADGGYLEWSAEQLDITRDQALIIYRTPLTGTFTFSEPVGGEWIAAFVPEGNTENDAFMFLDADGNKVSTISGPIDGSEATIRIVANYDPGNDNRRVRLLFSVRTPDGRTISANLLGSDYGRNTYFTIQQNARL